MPPRSLQTLRTGLKAVWLFAAAAILLIALGLWWLVYISQSISAQRDMTRRILGQEAEIYALRLLPERVPDGPLAVDPRLEVLESTAKLSSLARQLGDGQVVTQPRPGLRVVQPTPQTEAVLELRYARQRRMLMGEGSLLTGLLLTVVAMLWRLMRTETRFRLEMADFLGRVTHEMKTPLAGIKAVLQTLQAGRMPADQLQELTEMALRETEREEHLIQNLLLTQRMRLPDQRLAKDTVQLTQLLQRFVDHRMATRPAGWLSLEAPEGLQVLGDATAIATILENLGDNAQKYGATRVVLKAGAENRQVWVKMTDDGCGFAPELAEKLFEPFVRTEQVAGKARGTGLGLSLSRALAKRMGGQLTAESPGEGRGATFHLRLPQVVTTPGKKEIS